MKKYVALIAVATLAACAQTESESETESVEEVIEEAVPVGADGEPSPGLYTVTTAEGEVFLEDVKADGTYVTTNAEGEVIETGQWEQKSPEAYCTIVDEEYREEGETGEQSCNTEGINEDGVWFSTNAEGKTATVERATPEE